MRVRSPWAAFKYSVSCWPNNAVHPGRRRSAPSTASTDEDQRHPPPASPRAAHQGDIVSVAVRTGSQVFRELYGRGNCSPHLKPITTISARNLTSDEWSAEPQVR